jgi:hypothetical protein
MLEISFLDRHTEYKTTQRPTRILNIVLTKNHDFSIESASIVI